MKGWIFLIVGFCVGGTAWPQTLPEPLAREVSFAEDVHPILAEHCFRCHGGGKAEGDLSMGSREALLEGGRFGSVVEVGRSADSYLIQVVAGLDPEVVMPKEGARLPDEDIAVLRAWIDQGLRWEFVAAATPERQRPLGLTDVSLPEGPGLHGSEHAIDRFVRAYLDERNFADPPLIGDRRFVRRAYLDTTGLLPTTDELDDFLGVKDSDKREILIAGLLERDAAVAEHWMTFWNDALRNDFEGTGYIDGGREQITEWLYESLYENKPFDRFVRELIVPTEGSEGFRKGIVWRGVTAANQQPAMQAARNVAQVFLGVNLKCASCHDSFVDDWKLADAYGFAQCFSEEPLELVRCDVPTGTTAEARFLFPDLGTVDGEAPRADRLERVADLVTGPENGRFARTIVNRVWQRLMGYGLVEPADVMANASWHPELLDWLAGEFVRSGYDLRALMELIMTSRAYQLAADTQGSGEGPYRFQGPLVRRMPAEQFLDAVSCVTGAWHSEPKFTHASLSDEAVRAWRVAADPLTRALGRPNREQVITGRETAHTTLQALEMTNGEVLDRFIAEGAQALVQEGFGSSEALVDTVYLRALQRLPNLAERAVALSFFPEGLTYAGIEDFLWSVIMLPEYQLIY